MERRFDDELTIEGTCVATGKISCKVLKVKGNFFLYGGEIYCQELYVEGSVFLRGNLYMNTEGATLPASCKVVIGGGFFCEGLIAAQGGFMSIGGSFYSTSMVKLGYTRVKVWDHLTAKYLDCGEICVGGDINIDWGMFDAKGPIYARGDINATDVTSNLHNIYCGGKFMANRYSVGDVFENVTCWKNLD